MKRLGLCVLFLLGACSTREPVTPAAVGIETPPPAYEAQFHDGDRLMEAVWFLSGEALEGRASGSEGSLKAQSFILGQFAALGVQPFGESYKHDFTAPHFSRPEESATGTNIIGYLPGAEGNTGPAIVITAHYDHLGIVDGQIYPGADDNASGVAAMIETAAWFASNPPLNTVIFVATDAEEKGLAGAVDFVRSPPVPRERIAFNLNLDMVARADAGELYAVGTYHTPDLVPVVESVAEDAPITLLMGHDTPEDGDQDWTFMSDQAPFIQSGIPAIYLGVEDHPDYHKPSDIYDNIDPDAFRQVTDTIILMAQAVDDWVVDNPGGAPDIES